MLNWFKKKNPFQFPQTDMHNHVLPFVDDGCDSYEESWEMLRIFKSLGYRKIYLTPHTNESFHPNTKERLKEQFSEFLEKRPHDLLDLELALSSEYKTDELLRDYLKQDSVLPINDKFLLVELPFRQELLDWEQRLFEVQMAGYTVILAHAERYTYFFKKPAPLLSLIEKGIELQLNLPSLYGKYGNEVKRMAQFLLKKEAYQWVSTDAHSPHDMQSYKEKMGTHWPLKSGMDRFDRNIKL